MRSFLLPGIAALHRRRLDTVTFVAITGSAGKTTTKMLATTVLATAGRVQARSGNRVDKIMSSVCATDCILVQDDIHLPLGKLRSRAHGSDGGHKGVRSALVAFQTDAFRRLKIGVAPAEPPRSDTGYLLTPFGPAAAATIDAAVDAAVERLLSMIKVPLTERR
jgi:peptidyl-tRNA hydrolase